MFYSANDRTFHLLKMFYRNIRSVVMMWLEESHDDFREAPDYTCLHMIEEFARDVSHDVELQLRTSLLMTSFENEDSPKSKCSNSS